MSTKHRGREPVASHSLSATWGTTAAERARPFPCDPLLPEADAALYRGVTIAAPPERVFRWLCQLRVAPYSYDWIDNLGRQSPRQLTPGLDELAVGQEVMSIFLLADFRVPEHLTLRTKPGALGERAFGATVVSYVVVPETANACRLLVKIVARFPGGLLGPLLRHLLPWGDLVMMRRQLLNLKELAEAGERTA